MVNLLQLPYEVLGCIFRQSDPETWASASETCKTLHDYIARDHLLYKDYYLTRLVRFDRDTDRRGRFFSDK